MSYHEKLESIKAKATIEAARILGAEFANEFDSDNHRPWEYFPAMPSNKKNVFEIHFGDPTSEANRAFWDSFHATRADDLRDFCQFGRLRDGGTDYRIDLARTCGVKYFHEINKSFAPYFRCLLFPMGGGYKIPDHYELFMRSRVGDITPEMRTAFVSGFNAEQEMSIEALNFREALKFYRSNHNET